MISAIRILRFIRPRMATYIAFRALAGYLLFNGAHWEGLAVLLSIFFSNAAIYGYNQLTDAKEDIANKREAPPPEAKAVIAFSIALGLASSWLLGGVAPYFWLVLLAIGLLYSLLRVKGIFPLKNFYIALGGALFFLFGASPQATFEPAMYAGALLMAAIAYVSSLQADLRDIVGDRAAGVKTIPAVVSKSAGKAVAYAIISAMAVAVAALKLVLFYPLAVFAVPAAYYLGKEKYTASQTHLMLAVISLTPLVLILNGMGVAW